MHRQRRWTLSLVALLAATSAAFGADVPAGRAAFAPTRSDAANDVRALAAAIDRIAAVKWAEARVEPAAQAGDAEFLRRVSLDVAGVIPTVAETRAFLRDNDPDKRRKVVEKLLAGPGYVNHMTAVWKDLLVPEASGNNFQLGYFVGDFEVWLRRKFAEGAGYDTMVRELLTAPLGNGMQFFTPFGNQSKPSPFLYFAAKDGKPENLAAASSRLFLGIRVECAQCHDHPFARWKRDEFWGYAAFFAGVQRQGDGDAIFQARELTDRRELAIPGSERVVQAKFLDGSEPKWRSKTGPRVTLAEWVTSPNNAMFARAAVNRLWAQLFGTGLVDPIDEMEGEAGPSHPELLDELARQFVEHKFDLRFLVRAITASRVYGLSSAGYQPGQDDPRLFARAAIRGMSPRQLYDSYTRATGVNREGETPAFFGGDSPRKDFLERFASQDKATETRTSILQALTLMNGRLANDATSLERGATLPAVADSYFLDTPGKIEALYLATYNRKPRPEELDALASYVDRGGPTLNSKKALADVFWALLNSSEFVMNH